MTCEYLPPTGDEPLDAIEQAIVRMWIRIIAAEIREEAAREAAATEEIDPTGKEALG